MLAILPEPAASECDHYNQCLHEDGHAECGRGDEKIGVELFPSTGRTKPGQLGEKHYNQSMPEATGGGVQWISCPLGRGLPRSHNGDREK